MNARVQTSVQRRLVAEFFGTCFLLAMVVGSGIMGERLAGGNAAIALLANTLATGAGLAALITAFGPISGAHFNPAVTLSLAMERELPWPQVPGYLLAQISGAVLGVAAADYMFSLPLFFASTHVRTGSAQWLSEFIATFGLMSVILACMRHRSAATPWVVGAYIASAYWFTSSTCFANPAVTLARSFSDTFAGIRPQDVLAFTCAQLSGALTATLLFRWLSPELNKSKA